MSDDLQFDRAEFATTPAASCGACQAVLSESYYQANSQLLCARCADGLTQALLGTGTRFGRAGKALLLGSAAALVGALIHFSVLHFLEINAALVTILMGWLVGKGVRNGSGGRGGWRYQLMAVLLTYLSIAMAYVPLLIGELRSGRAENAVPAEQAAAGAVADVVSPDNSAQPDSEAAPSSSSVPAVADSPVEKMDESLGVAGLLMLIGGAMVALLFSLPVIVGMDSPLSLLIFGFGLFQAWQMNKRAVVDVTGPHALAEREATPVSGA